jgi:hypothetical protein
MALNIVPVASQTLASSQPQIQQNFTVLDTSFSQNHVPYNDASGYEGKHALVQFNPFTTGSVPATSVGDVSLYNIIPSAPYPLTGVQELFLVKSDGATSIPITASVQAAEGWCYLPSGVLIKWGTTGSINSASPFVYTYPVATDNPVFQHVYSVQLTLIDNNPPFSGSVAVQTGTVTTTGFHVVYNGAPASSAVVSYLVIGN